MGGRDKSEKGSLGLGLVEKSLAAKALDSSTDYHDKRAPPPACSAAPPFSRSRIYEILWRQISLMNRILVQSHSPFNSRFLSCLGPANERV